jgi:hypothetical protein
MGYSRKNNKKRTQRRKSSACIGLPENKCVFPCRTVKKKHMEIYGHCRAHYAKNKYHLDESSKRQIEKLLLNLKAVAREGDKVHNQLRGLEKRAEQKIQKAEKLTKVATKVKESALEMKDIADKMKTDATNKNNSVVGMATNLIKNIGTMVSPTPKEEAPQTEEPVNIPSEDKPTEVQEEAPMETQDEAPMETQEESQEEVPMETQEESQEEVPMETQEESQETTQETQTPPSTEELKDKSMMESVSDTVSNLFKPPVESTEVIVPQNVDEEKKGGKRRKRRKSRSNKKRI